MFYLSGRWAHGFHTIVPIAESFWAIVAIPAIIWTQALKIQSHGREIDQNFTVKCQIPWVCPIPPATAPATAPAHLAGANWGLHEIHPGLFRKFVTFISYYKSWPKPRTNALKKGFGYRGSVIWNTLPKEKKIYRLWTELLLSFLDFLYCNIVNFLYFS